MGSIEDPVTTYVSQLKGSAYDGVSIRDDLMMSSGVKWNETYTDPKSDRRRLLEAQIAQVPGSAIALMRTLPRAAPPGTVNNYSTGETQIAGEVLRNAVGRSLSQYLSERVWARFGMESDATWWLESTDGAEIAGSGFSATLRDYGRFGLFVLNDGVAGGEQVLPRGWAGEAGAAKTLKTAMRSITDTFGGQRLAADPNRSGSAYAAIGIFGQCVYINPAEHVVIVVWSARSKPVGMDIVEDQDFLSAVVSALR